MGHHRFRDVTVCTPTGNIIPIYYFKDGRLQLKHFYIRTLVVIPPALKDDKNGLNLNPLSGPF